jgi:peptide-methionine (S)-S-oxide reductase
LKKLATLAVLLLLAAVFLYGCGGNGSRESTNTTAPEPAASAPEDTVEEAAGPGEGLERIVLGGGCFWCTEAVMELADGVVEVTSGYAGGDTADPTYEQVCTGDTGHAEVVAVDYDPTSVTLEGLLDVFFATHDPTALNRQGADVGSQYRSVILYGSAAQESAVRNYIEKAQESLDDPIVTEVRALERFYPAEEYHQDYYEKNPDRPYCATVISPKVKKALEMLEER